MVAAKSNLSEGVPNRQTSHEAGIFRVDQKIPTGRDRKIRRDASQMEGPGDRKGPGHLPFPKNPRLSRPHGTQKIFVDSQIVHGEVGQLNSPLLRLRLLGIQVGAETRVSVPTG